MSAKRFEGKNLDEALDGAARAFGVERFRISYHVVLEKRGFLGGTKRVVIEAEVSHSAAPESRKPDSRPAAPREERPRREEKPKRQQSRPEQKGRPEPQSRPEQQSRPERPKKRDEREKQEQPERPRPSDRRPPEREDEDGPRKSRRRRRGGRGRRRGNSSEEGTSNAPRNEERPVSRPPLEVIEAPDQGEQSEDAVKITEWCRNVFSLSGLELVARTTENDEQIEVELYGADVSLIDEGIADLLDSLQVLANKTFTGRQFERRVEFDAGGFKKRREQELIEEARQVAERVRDEGRERTMRAMSPIERRIVHVALEEVEGIATESRGRGFHKRVVILPVEEDERAAAGES